MPNDLPGMLHLNNMQIPQPNMGMMNGGFNPQQLQQMQQQMMMGQGMDGMMGMQPQQMQQMQQHFQQQQQQPQHQQQQQQRESNHSATVERKQAPGSMTDLPRTRPAVCYARTSW